MQIKDIPGTHTARRAVPGQATIGTSNVWPVFEAPANIKITGCRWVPDEAVTGANTHNFSLAFQNRTSAGIGTTALTTTKTYASGTNSVQADTEVFTLTSTAADLLVASGDVLALVRTITGNGLASPSGTVEIDFQYR